MMKSEKNKEQINVILKQTAIVSGIFSLVVCSVVILNFIQLVSVQPLQSPLLEELISLYRENPQNDKVKEEIRGLDLLVRKAFFTQQWHIRTGGYLLALGLGLFFLSLGLRRVFVKKIPSLPGQGVRDTTGRSRFLMRVGIGFVFCIIIMAGLIFLLLSDNILASYTETVISGENKEDNVPTVELIVDQWPTFRGPFGNAVAGKGEYPVEWDGSTGQNVIWKTKIPKKGFNSPVVWDNRIFLSGADEQSREVYCLDAHTGGILWQNQVVDRKDSSVPLPEVSEDTGFAAPTMATDGQLAFALFATGILVCYDNEGALIWSRDMGIPDNIYGQASSLMLFEQTLYVQYDQEETAALYGLDTKNGNIRWKTDRDVLTSWASPIIAGTNDDGLSIVLNANPLVAAYDLSTGAELWQVDIMMGEVAPSCAWGCGFVFAANQFASLVAIDPGTAEYSWEYYDDLPNVSSPCSVNGFVFVPTSYGVVTCLDCQTGEILRIHEFDEGFYSSPIAAGDNIYILDMNGRMSIFKASKEFDLTGEAELGEDTMATPAFVRGRIYIRGEEHLFCIGETE